MTRPTWLIVFVTTSLLLVPTLQLSSSAQTEAMDTIAGEEKPIGKGKVRTWLKVDKKTREPKVLGVTLTEAGLQGLPDEKDEAQAGSVKLKLMDGGPDHTFEYELKFPAEA